ncbi:MAG: outer membrane protein assembly factor BamE [Akkermansiaceae bacterium]
MVLITRLKIFSIALLVIATAGCVTSSKNLAKINTGMSKQQVIQILGTARATLCL